MVSFKKTFFNEPSPSARRLLWHVLSVGLVSRDEPEIHEGFDKPGAFLFWVKSGTGEILLPRSSTSYPLAAGSQCWLVALREPRTYLPKGEKPLVTAGIRFGGPNLDAWLESLVLDHGHQFSLKADLDLARTEHSKVIQLVKCCPEGYEWRVHESLTRILGFLLKTRNVFTCPEPDTHESVKLVLKAVLDDPNRNWKVAELVEIAGAGYSRLRDLFLVSQQENLHEFLERVRLDRSRLLLRDHRLSIKEISGKLNFSSQHYFSHFFSRRTGMSPTQFRRN